MSKTPDQHFDDDEQPLWLTLDEAARTLQLVAGKDDPLAQAVEAKLDELLNL